MVSGYNPSRLSSVLCLWAPLHPGVSISTEERNAEGDNPAMDQHPIYGKRELLAVAS